MSSWKTTRPLKNPGMAVPTTTAAVLKSTRPPTDSSVVPGRSVVCQTRPLVGSVSCIPIWESSVGVVSVRITNPGLRVESEARYASGPSKPASVISPDIATVSREGPVSMDTPATDSEAPVGSVSTRERSRWSRVSRASSRAHVGTSSGSVTSSAAEFSSSEVGGSG